MWGKRLMRLSISLSSIVVNKSQGRYLTIRSEGQITDFLRTPPSKSQKNHIQKSQNHKKITHRKHKKSQITENLLKNHTKKSLKSNKIAKKSQKKSCDFKITNITYAILRSHLPLDSIIQGCAPVGRFFTRKFWGSCVIL